MERKRLTPARLVLAVLGIIVGASLFLWGFIDVVGCSSPQPTERKFEPRPEAAAQALLQEGYSLLESADAEIMQASIMQDVIASGDYAAEELKQKQGYLEAHREAARIIVYGDDVISVNERIGQLGDAFSDVKGAWTVTLATAMTDIEELPPFIGATDNLTYHLLNLRDACEDAGIHIEKSES